MLILRCEELVLLVCYGLCIAVAYVQFGAAYFVMITRLGKGFTQMFHELLKPAACLSQSEGLREIKTKIQVLPEQKCRCFNGCPQSSPAVLHGCHSSCAQNCDLRRCCRCCQRCMGAAGSRGALAGMRFAKQLVLCHQAEERCSPPGACALGFGQCGEMCRKAQNMA